MADPVLVYLAHPVGAVDAAGVEANLGRARQWLRWLIDLPNPAVGRIAWVLPWWAYVDALGDGAPRYRERGLRDTLAVLERCDALLALGRPTPGVVTETATAQRAGLPVVDWIAAGPLPPSTSETNWWTLRPTAARIAELVVLVASVERKRALRAERLAGLRTNFCATCNGTGKELLDCDGTAGFRPCTACGGGR